MLTEAKYLRIARASAIYDLVVTIGFVTPWSFALIIRLIGEAHDASGLPGTIPQLDVWHVLFANLMGSVIVVWSVLRLHLSLAIFGRYDMAARLLFSAWQANALFHGASWTLIAFLVMELAFGVLQALPYRAEQAGSAASGRTAVIV